MQKNKMVLNGKGGGVFVFAFFSLFYMLLAWLCSGGETWWIIDIINGTNVFYGDDGYRFYLARSAWLDVGLYTYNFVLPVSLTLDAFLISLVGGDLLYSRMLHGIVGAISLSLLWGAGCRLGINRLIMLCGVLVVGLTPRFAFTTLSFYGELWLGAGLCILLWLLTTHRYTACAVIAGLMPLVRPEGIYFLIFLWFLFLFNKNWKAVIISPLPGAVYALYLYCALPDLGVYSGWRDQLTAILVKIPFNNNKWEIVDTFSLWLVGAGFFGLFYRPVRIVFPLILAALVAAVILQILVFMGLAKYEERYVYHLFPVLALLWAAAMQQAMMCAEKYKLRIVVLPLIGLLVIMPFVDGMRTLTQVEIKIRQYGAWAVLENIYKHGLRAVFIHHDQDALTSRLIMAAKVEELLASDPGVDRLIVGDPFLFYELDPAVISQDVVVGFPATSYMVFHLLLDGQVFVQHSRGRKYSYLSYGEPDFRKGERRALYVDHMPMSNYPYTWNFEGLQYKLYLFSYLEALKPTLDLSSVPALTNKDIRGAWQEWLRSRASK